MGLLPPCSLLTLTHRLQSVSLLIGIDLLQPLTDQTSAVPTLNQWGLNSCGNFVLYLTKAVADVVDHLIRLRTKVSGFQSRLSLAIFP